MKPGPNFTLALLGLVLLALALVVLRLLDAAWAHYLTAVWLYGAVLLGMLACVDGLVVRRESAPRVHRQLPRSLALGRKNEVSLTLINNAGRVIAGRVTDHYPQSLQVEGIPRGFSLPDCGEVTIPYTVLPQHRGVLDFDCCEVEIESRWRFWQRSTIIRQPEELRVYPDFLTIGHLREFSDEEGASLLGVHLQRKRGEGTEFQQLREFREGDILRQVDWKASARLCKLNSRDYQDENDRDLVFLLDCGRRMRSKDGNLTHFDHALNAILLTSYFAQRQGDGVGVCTFAGEPRWVEPRKGNAGINYLLNQLYDLQTTTQSTDFLEAVNTFMRHHSKRALVVLVSCIQTEDEKDLNTAVQLLQQRHAVIVVNMQETQLVQDASSDVHNFEAALKHGVALDLLQQRERVMRKLRHQGTWTIDSLPGELSQRLVEQYLSLKRAGAV